MSAAGNPAGRQAPGLRVVPVFVLAAGLAGLTAACGSSSGSSATTSATTSAAASATTSAGASTSATATPTLTGTPTPTATATSTGTGSAAASPAATGKLTGSAAVALAASAITATEAAKSVRVAGQNVGTGTGTQKVTFDLTLVKNVGCSGTISLSAAQTFKIIDTGGYVWLLPNSAFYTSQHISKQAQALLADKYIKVKSTDKQIGTLGQICTFSGLFGSMPTPAGSNYTATPTTYHGQAAYDVTQAGKAGAVVVANTTPPLLLQISDSKTSGGTITFANYDAVTAIKTPSAAETVDGTQLGI